jgi:hypothetical protein
MHSRARFILRKIWLYQVFSLSVYTKRSSNWSYGGVGEGMQVFHKAVNQKPRSRKV